MRLEKIIEQLNLIDLRKKAFENNKTLKTYQEYFSVLGDNESKKLKKSMEDSGYTFTLKGIEKDDKILDDKDEIILNNETN